MGKLRELCKDTFFRGALAGIVGGFAKDMVSLVLKAFKLLEHTYMTLHAVVAFNQMPQRFIESFFGFVLDLVLSGFIGLLYSLLVRSLKTRHYLLLGFFAGSLVWFIVKAFILAFNVRALYETRTPVTDPIFNWLLSAMYGVIVASLDRWWAPHLESGKA